MKPESAHWPSKSFIDRVVRRRAPVFATLFALLFTIIAVSQYLFVRRGVFHAARQQMQQWASQVVAEIDYKTNWDLTTYRQSASVQAPSTIVMTSDGIIIETKGFVRGLIGKVKLTDQSIFDGPKDVQVVETGETWRELGVRVDGGCVVLGILNFRSINAPDELLHATAERLGPTVNHALSVRTGETSSEVDYAIIDDSGNLLFAAEGLPLKADAATVARLSNASGTVRCGDMLCLLLSRPISDSFGNKVGMVVIPRDVTDDERVISQHKTFNVAITLTAWGLALVLVLGYLGVEDWQQRPRAVPLEIALKNGESQSVEFKQGLPDNALAAAMAAFANTNSGTIFLGVDDRGQVVGISCETPQRKDEELKRVRLLASEKLKPGISIMVDFLEHDGKVVLRIFVPRSEHPLCLLDHEIYVRDQNASVRAKPEQVQRILKNFYR